MSLFFHSLFLMVAGGVAALLFHKKPTLARLLPVTATCAGSITGLAAVVSNLTLRQPATFECLWLQFIPLSFRMDALSAFFLFPIFVIAFLAALYSFDYLDQAGKRLRIGAHYFFFSLLVAAMGLVVCADNIVSLALSWELMSISSCFLVLHDYESKDNRRAAFIFFVFAQAGAMFLFAAFSLLYAQTGSLNLASASQLTATFKLVVFVLAFIGFGSKAGIFPFHIWLPHAHTAAPSHISAFMSGVMIKMGIYGIIRFYFLLGADSAIYGQIVLCFGAVSGVLGIVYALGQHNIKRMLAYSSIENIGIILIGLGMGMLGVSSGQPVLAFWCFSGSFLHILNHSLFKSLLFMGAGSVLHGTGTAAMDRMGGLFKRMPFTGAFFLAGSLAICALPPFNGFVSELLIYSGTFFGSSLEGSYFLFAVLAIVSLAIIGGLALACFTKAVGIVFLGEPRTEQAENVHECRKLMRLSMGTLASACLAIGIFPALFVTPLASMTTSLLNMPDAPLAKLLNLCRHVSLATGLFFGLCLLIILLRSYLYRSKKIAWGPTWGCGFTRATARIQYTGASFSSPLLEFFGAAAPVNEEYSCPDDPFPETATYHSSTVDLAERVTTNGVALPVLRVLKRLRWIQHGNIQFYIAYIVIAIILATLLTYLM